MAQQREKGGRVVFIGNIPYGVSEEQICDIFSSAGSVVSFRLVYDKETGRPKGFGFLEYADTDAAATAVRNLNDTELNGRTLRVDYSNDNSGSKSGGGGASHGADGSGRAPPPAHFGADATAAANGDPAALPALPAGQDLPLGLTAPDAISKTLSALPAPQLLDIMSQMKGLATSNPAQATALFTSAPQLGYATFQALLLLGLVDTNVLGSLIQQTTQAPPPPQPQPQPPAPAPAPAYAQAPGMPPQPSYSGAPVPGYGSAPPQHQAYGPPAVPPQAYTATPPIQQPAYQPPPPAAAAAPSAPASGAVPMPADPQQAQMIQTVLNLTREQIYAMDENSRNQILTLRAQFGAPVY